MKFPGRLALQQRVIPAYRAPFFELLAKSCEDGLALFAGQPLPVESIATTDDFNAVALTPACNRYFREPQSPLYLCWQQGMIPWLEKQNPATLIVEANPRYLSTPRAVRWMKQRKRPVLGWGLGVPRGGNSLECLFRQNFLRSLDGVIAYSRRGAEEYRALGLTNVFVSFNAVSPRPGFAPPLRPDALEGPATVLYVGRLQTRKKIDILLQACANFSEDQRPRLVIIGDGPAHAEFQSMAEQIYPAAEFVGARHGSELEPYFLAADVFVLPGTGGLAVQQAMAYALPVIVAQGDGTQDDLVRPENGWQVPPGDQTAFTATLRTALSDIPRLRRMGQESYRIVSEEINLGTMVNSFVAVLNQIQIEKMST